MSVIGPQRPRIHSLDQFRGYTVLGMFLVNFVGGFQACHYVLEHHNTFCSYADTIMPQFFFAVGFAFRLTFARRVARQGSAAAYLRVVRRLLGLMLVALVMYTADPPAVSWEEFRHLGLWEILRVPVKRDWFQTLMHIAVTSLWILPVINCRARTRLIYLAGSALLHLLLSWQFYFLWVNNGQPNGIDGGPLGFLTWTIPTLTGTLACDMVTDADGRLVLRRMLFWSAVLMVAGYAFSCGTRLYDVPQGRSTETPVERLASHPVWPPAEAWQAAADKLRAGRWDQLLAELPFVPPPHPDGDIGQSYRQRQWNYWMMSQRSGTLSYLTFSSGFSLFVFALFFVICDRWRWQWGVFRTFGTNALAAYVLHMLVASAVKPFLPRDCPAWYLTLGCLLFLLVTYVLVRALEKSGIYVKL
jgi:predicted acyltransferase